MKRWPRLRLWLLAAAFACGQLFMLAHAAEHEPGDADEPAHACLLCVAGHDLGTPAPAVAQADWPSPATHDSVLPAILPLLQGAAHSAVRARGPPLA